MPGTQLEKARAGRTTAAMRAAAAAENISPDHLRKLLATGQAVLPCNPAHRGLTPLVVGRDFKTKINANIGRSAGRSDTARELRKLRAALAAGADCVMDLSVGANLGALRRRLLAACPRPFGTVPVYEAVSRNGGKVENFDPDVLFKVITEQAQQGVDFMTLHAGLLRRHLPLAHRRLAGIVSRGGAIMAHWMSAHNRENPLYARWDEVLEICRRHDVTVSLGDALRPGCIADASDAAQFAELSALGRLVRRCREAGVQVMVEGPGHIPFNQIKDNMQRAHRVCAGAPFYVLGPVVTDVAPGYDHITACIGATAAAAAGAALLCYVTPAEHLGLPNIAEVTEGIMAFRIAAHAADLAKGLPGARDWDDAMTRARVSFDWPGQFKLALNPDLARRRFRSKSRLRKATKADHCSMCGEGFCAMRVNSKIRKDLASRGNQA
ncbi:MAG: phosphomethylpyrimidine synthase ThiC [Kiritimatiellia bacterium]